MNVNKNNITPSFACFHHHHNCIIILFCYAKKKNVLRFHLKSQHDENIVEMIRNNEELQMNHKASSLK